MTDRVQPTVDEINGLVGSGIAPDLLVSSQH
jgi:hypothetical protein